VKLVVVVLCIKFLHSLLSAFYFPFIYLFIYLFMYLSMCIFIRLRSYCHRDVCIPGGGKKYISGMGNTPLVLVEVSYGNRSFPHNLLSAISLPTFAVID